MDEGPCAAVSDLDCASTSSRRWARCVLPAATVQADQDEKRASPVRSTRVVRWTTSTLDRIGSGNAAMWRDV